MTGTVRLTLTLVAAATLLGCGVNKETHQKALNELAACQTELSQTKGDLDSEKQKTADLESKLAGAQTAQTEKEKRIKALLDDMEKNKQSAEEELLRLKRQQEQNEARLAAYRKLNDRLRQLVDTGKLEVAFRNGQMILKLPSEVLFDSGKAELKGAGKTALGEVLTILLEFKDRRFQIAGHTDNVAIKTRQFKSNWELSAARAVSVVKAMVEAGFDPKNLSASGFGEFDPVAEKGTPEGRQANRRIEIILVPDLSELPNLTANPS